mgnify:CR=1 FL=1
MAASRKRNCPRKNVQAVSDGFTNLAKQVENMRGFGLPVLVAINKFATDTPAEIDMLLKKCESYGVDVSLNECWEKGGEGGIDMANKLVDLLEHDTSKPVELYDVNDTIPHKLEAIVTKVYGGDGVDFTPNAKKQIKLLEDWALINCLSAWPRPSTPSVTTRPFWGHPRGSGSLSRMSVFPNGAGFIVCQTSNIMVMPGLPKKPAALNMDIDASGKISGLF